MSGADILIVEFETYCVHFTQNFLQPRAFMSCHEHYGLNSSAGRVVSDFL